MKIKRSLSRQARVEILPLMDVIFLLLVFFIFAMLSMTVHRGVKLSLPSSSSAQPETKSVLAVSIQENNQVFFNKTVVEDEQMDLLLKEKMKKGEISSVQLFADQKVSYQRVFYVLDQIKNAGIENVSLQADQGK